MKRFRWVALVAALLLVAAACGDDDDVAATTAAPAATATTAADTVDLSQGSDLTFHMVTHSDDGVFWSVVKKGAEDAAAALGVNMVWSPSSNDPTKQVQDIEAAIAAGSSGIGVSLANPTAVVPAAKAAVDAGIPVVTLNSGVNDYLGIGALTHVGQTEIVAGEGAGLRFNNLGATNVLCARQEQGNIGLEERCTGLANTFSGSVDSQFIGLDTEPETQIATIAAILAADPSIDGVLGTGPNVAVRAVDAGAQAGVDLVIGGFDVSNDIIAALNAGDVDFTVDQQQYLQGYLPIVLMYLFVTNLNTAGGGLPILTGPGFIDTANVAEVEALVNAGTR